MPVPLYSVMTPEVVMRPMAPFNVLVNQSEPSGPEVIDCGAMMATLPVPVV